MRECKICKVSIMHRRHSAKYCGVICRTKAKNKREEKYKKECTGCGKEFETWYPYQIYCEKACCLKDASKVEYEEKPCAVCKKDFKPKTRSNIYCSSDCRQGYKGTKQLYCRSCGNPVFNRNQKTCSWCVDNIPGYADWSPERKKRGK